MITKTVFVICACGHAGSFRVHVKRKLITGGTEERSSSSGNKSRTLEPTVASNISVGEERERHDFDSTAPESNISQELKYEAKTHKKEFPKQLLYGTIILGVLLFVFMVVRLVRLRASTQTNRQRESVNRHAEMALSIKRKSGETLATVHARYWWSGDTLRDEVSQHLASGEYLHSILYETDASQYRVEDFYCIGDRGIKDGSQLTVILMTSYALPSGVSLFSFKKRVGGPQGAHNIARLWLHENKSASLECGEFIDVGVARAKYLESTVNEKGQLHFQNDGKYTEGVIEEWKGKQRIIGLHLPTLGKVVLEQDRPDALFDVSQTSAFVGWISIFEGSEMVAKLTKKVPEGTACEAVHLRFRVWTKMNSDGSAKINFAGTHDFDSWNGEEKLGVAGSSLSARLSGGVGYRKLELTNFPLIGSVTLVEHPLCSDMVDGEGYVETVRSAVLGLLCVVEQQHRNSRSEYHVSCIVPPKATINRAR